MLFKKRTRKQNNTGFKKYVTKEELLKILDSFNEREQHLKMITLLLAFTGLRISEILPLKITDFSDGFKMVKANIKKQKKVKSRIVCEPLANIVKQYCKSNYHRFSNEGHLFCSDNPASVAQGYKHIQMHSFSTMWHRKMKQLGFNYTYFKNHINRSYNRITPHTLRHFFVSMLLKDNDIHTVSQIIGHAKITTTMQYFFDPSAVGIENKAVNEAFNKFFADGFKYDAKQKGLGSYF